ncbi:MAG: hypothetical protein ABIP75_18860 [Pyrinomonadaceae bacterium]
MSAGPSVLIAAALGDGKRLAIIPNKYLNEAVLIRVGDRHRSRPGDSWRKRRADRADIKPWLN